MLGAYSLLGAQFFGLVPTLFIWVWGIELANALPHTSVEE
jgi:hypothetical protein